MTLLLGEADVRRTCEMGAMVKRLESVLLAEANARTLVMPPRQNLAYGDVFLRVMPAILGGAGIMGLKVFHGRLADGVRYVVMLCSVDTGEVLAIVDGAYLTAVRTGATSGVATKHLARADATTVGVIGSGLEARTNLAAMAAVRDLDLVRVFSPRAERRAAFASEMSAELGVDVEVAADPAAAVAGMAMVLVATNTGAGGPVAYQGAWLEPGQHLVSIGSTTAALREVDVDTLVEADLVVTDVELATMADESGDVAALAASGRQLAADPVLLSELVAGRHQGRDRPEAVTVFKSVGTAAQDLAGALAVYEEARHLGIGREVGEIAQPRTF